jgi:hypothetical protein
MLHSASDFDGSFGTTKAKNEHKISNLDYSKLLKVRFNRNSSKIIREIQIHVQWEYRNGTSAAFSAPADKYRDLYGNGNDNHKLRTDLYANKGII